MMAATITVVGLVPTEPALGEPVVNLVVSSTAWGEAGASLGDEVCGTARGNRVLCTLRAASARAPHGWDRPGVVHHDGVPSVRT